MASSDRSLRSSQTLGSSTSSLSPSRKGLTHISKVYKQASQLFLTRQLSETLALLEPVVTGPAGSKEDDAHGEVSQSQAPIAFATSSQRIKIWSLYITLLNTIADLTDAEGKNEIGAKKFKAIVNEVRSGEIWESVVRAGYGGREDVVEPEVVNNLATLLLGQASDQFLTQRRLETYLASSPSLDISNHLQYSPARRSRTNGTNTPKDLSSRLSLVELFTLHVLPRNEEWEYARSFISNSDLLDEERREAFLQTLEELRDVREPEDELDELLDEDVLNTPKTVTSVSEIPTEQPPGHKRSGSEVDYGIDSPQRNLPANGVAKPIHTAVASPLKKTPKAEPLDSSTPKPRNGFSSAATKSSSSKKTRLNGRSDLSKQAWNVYCVLQNLTSNMLHNLTGSSAAILRILLFVVALLTVLGNGSVRERLQRIVGTSWDKLRETIGMGVKVSYI